MNKLKILKIIHIVGYASLFVATVLSLVNKIADKLIFKEWLLLPLLIIGLVGIVSGIIYITKLPRDTGSEQDTKTSEKDDN